MANVIEFLLLAKNQASPELRKAGADLKAFFSDVQGKLGQSARGDVIQWGQAWGTAGGAVKAGAGAARGGITELDFAAKRAASGGIQELAGQIPVVGNALGNLATRLTGFPLILGGIIGVGAGVLSFLKGMSDDAGKATAAMSALAEKIGTDFQASVLEVQKINAAAAQDRQKVIELSAQQEIQAAEATKQARIAAAREELNQIDMFGRRRTELSKEALAEIDAAEAEFATKTVVTHATKNAQLATLNRERVALAKELALAAGQAEAEGAAQALALQGKDIEALQVSQAAKRVLLEKDHTDQLKRIQELFGSDEKGYELRTDAARKFHADTTKLATEAAEQQKALIEATTAAAIGIAEKLGQRFADIAQKLKVATFVQDTQKQILELERLKGALASGDATLQKSGLTIAEVTRLQQELTSKMQEATTKGWVPATEAANKNTEAMTTAGQVAKAVTDSIAESLFNLGAASEETIARLDALIKKGQEIQAKAGGGAGGGVVAGGGGPITASGGVTISGDGNTILAPGLPGGTVLGGILNQPKGSGLTPFTSSTNLSAPGGSFQHGGVVPVMAHRGEIIDQPQRIVRRLGQAIEQVHGRRGGRSGGGGGGVTVRLERGAVQYNGGVITHADRDFANLTEILAQRLGERMRR